MRSADWLDAVILTERGKRAIRTEYSIYFVAVHRIRDSKCKAYLGNSSPLNADMASPPWDVDLESISRFPCSTF